MNAAKQEKAAKLRNVMEPFMRARHLETRTQAELETAGIAAYQKEFGHAITGRWFRALYTRTLERGQAHEDWMRLELYLDDSASAPGPKSQSKSTKPKFNHASLGHRLAFRDPASPTLSERQNALEYSFVHFEDLLAACPGRRNKIKRSILTFLFSAAPALAESPAALKRSWYRKYDRWKKNGQTPNAIADLRAAPSACPWKTELEADLQLIVEAAFHLDGKLAIAIRKLRREGQLSPKFIDRYTLDVRRDKSYVAKSIRKEITARLTGLLAYRHSAWKVNMQGPRIAREHDYAPGDYFAADDCTFNIVFWYMDEHGRPAVTRGEVLLFFDCRSLYPLGYVLTPGKYNGEIIRRAILNVHDKHGLPHRGFIFERGVWESRLLLGSRPRDFLGWDEYDMGLRDKGLRLELRNAHTPQGKLIETIFNILQQNQRNEKGFVGFNEREYGQERLQKFIGRVKRGLVHPSTEFRSDVEWRDALDRSLETYMREPQNGDILQGVSPAEKFGEHKPLRRLSDESRFILASHRVRAKVKSDGITIEIRGRRRSFYNKALSPYHGREVFAWFNIEQPDLLTVSTLDGKTFFSVKRQVLSAFDATDEQLKESNRERFGFMRAPKLLFDQIKHTARRSITRDDILDDEASALGRHIRQQTEQHETEQAEEKRAFNRLARVSDTAGVPMRSGIRNPAAETEAIALELECRRELSAAQYESPEIPAPSASVEKTHTLQSAPSSPPTVKQFFALWAQVEKAKHWQPDMRYALTTKTIGCCPMPQKMTLVQLAKMIFVFSAILRDCHKLTV